VSLFEYQLYVSGYKSAIIVRGREAVLSFCKLTNTETMKIAIEKVKKGDFFRRLNGVAVFSHSGYCKLNKKYQGDNVNDISSFSYFKKGTIVETEFTF
jgi:hypothetical protein